MSVTPDFVGQRYKDTATGNIWIANSTNAGDWTLEVQNFSTFWEPKTLRLDRIIGIYSYGYCEGITSLRFDATTNLCGFDIENMLDCTRIEFPNLVSVDPTASNNGNFTVANCTALTHLIMPSLVTLGKSCYISGNSALEVIDFSSYIPTPTIDQNFSANALSQATVDLILARCVASPTFGNASEVITLNGGTNAPPSSTGAGSDYATLEARGATIFKNS